MELMPCGHNTSWMVRTSDRGIRFKNCLLCICKGIGLEKDAYGTPYPETFKKKEPKKVKKTVEKDITEVKKDDSMESSKGTYERESESIKVSSGSTSRTGEGDTRESD